MRERRQRRQGEHHDPNVNTAPRDLEIEMQPPSSATRMPARADISNLAPDNEEEALVYHQQGFMRRVRRVLFPDRSL